jgi:hypothetical protein
MPEDLRAGKAAPRRVRARKDYCRCYWSFPLDCAEFYFDGSQEDIVRGLAAIQRACLC